MSDFNPAKESTTLSVLCQAYTGGAKKKELQWLIDSLQLENSKEMINDLFAGGDGQGLRKYVNSIRKQKPLQPSVIRPQDNLRVWEEKYE